MSRARRIAWLTLFAWKAAWRRWIVFGAPALLALVVLSQIPRMLFLASRFAGEAASYDAVAGYAELVGSIYDGCLLTGAVLALALGASATGGRKLRRHLAPILARPVSRVELLVGRLAGNALVVVSFWLFAALLLETMRHVLDAPVRIAAAAFLFPLMLHLILLVLGGALGTFVPALPATFAGLTTVWGALFLLNVGSAQPAWLRALSVVARWCLPPLDELLRASAPFLTSVATVPRAALLAQAACWIGIFAGVAIGRFERFDFFSRAE